MVTSSLHPADVVRYMQVLLVAKEAVKELGLRMPDIRPAPEPKRLHSEGVYGLCHQSGEIHIVLRFMDHNGFWLGPLPEWEVYDTLAHELAHLRHMDHSQNFWDYNKTCQAAVTRVRYRR